MNHQKPCWIWYPEQRSLPCTFVFFRKEIELDGKCGKATGTIAADSRYQLFVNGKRIQRGPAPFDPRYQELDPVDLSGHLVSGKNCIGVIVFSFGHVGEGTYIPGVPGLRFELYLDDGKRIVSDKSWKVHRATCWPAGHYRRSFLRGFQEEFDARKYPDGWAETGFDAYVWMDAWEMEADPDKPLLSSPQILNTMIDYKHKHDWFYFRRRSIPFLKEERIPCGKLLASGSLEWKVSPEEYFEAYTRNAFVEHNDGIVPQTAPFPLAAREIKPGYSTVFLFELHEEMVGYPYLKIAAKAGTVVEVIFAEARISDASVLPEEPGWKGRYARFICKDGLNEFEAFDWDAVKFLAVTVRNNDGGEVRLLESGVTRMLYPFPHEADFSCSDPAVERVFAGACNTCRNLSFETVVDNVARERQLYAGEVALTYLGHYLAYGEYRLARRCLVTLGDGQHGDGNLFASYPAIDCLERMWQNSLGLFGRGAIVDHSFGYIFHLYWYTLYSGDVTLVHELKDKIVKFAAWIDHEYECHNGLIPAGENGELSCWVDTMGFLMERHKEAALNIYYYGVLSVAFKNIFSWLDEPRTAKACEEKAWRLKEKIFRRFRDDDGLIVDNLPWLQEENNIKRYHDRTLSMSLIFSFFETAATKAQAVKLLCEHPDNMGFSHPPNAFWRFWALNIFNSKRTIVDELRNRWSSMASLMANNTFSEHWDHEMGPVSAMCQCACSGPLYAIYNVILGVNPKSRGFVEYEINPMLDGLEQYSGTVYVPDGQVKVAFQKSGEPTLELELPSDKQVVIKLSRPITSAWLDGRDHSSELAGKTEIILRSQMPQSLKLTFEYNRK